jgi:hypothetical protein
MAHIRKSDVIRIGKLQKKKLEGMAAASNVSIRDFLDTLIDNADELKVEIRRKVDFNLLIDAEHTRRIEQYPTLAEVERREKNGSTK